MVKNQGKNGWNSGNLAGVGRVNPGVDTRKCL
jgi:hypothetical protein